MLVSNMHKSAVSAHFRRGSLWFFSFPLFYSPDVFEFQIVEITLYMAQRMWLFRIAASHVQAMRANFVAPVTA